METSTDYNNFMRIITQTIWEIRELGKSYMICNYI